MIMATLKSSVVPDPMTSNQASAKSSVPVALHNSSSRNFLARAEKAVRQNNKIRATSNPIQVPR